MAIKIDSDLVNKAIAQLCAHCSQNSAEHGFHDSDRCMSEEIALQHSELSEVLEALRDPGVQLSSLTYRDKKPEGVAAEYADLLIRVFDTCGHRDIPLAAALLAKMAYNQTRPHKHGKAF